MKAHVLKKTQLVLLIFPFDRNQENITDPNYDGTLKTVLFFHQASKLIPNSEATV